MSAEKNKQVIEEGRAVLGIELGSTRIKAVLVNEENQPIASGSHEWENQYVNNIWTYSEEAIWTGIQDPPYFFFFSLSRSIQRGSR